MFSEETKRLLLAAGWYPGRRVDVSKSIQRLTRMGFGVHPSVEAFLAEYGGLKLSGSVPFLDSAGFEYEFSVDRAVLYSDPDYFDWCAEYAKERVTPVGVTGALDSVFAVGVSGGFYLAHEDFLQLRGHGSEEGIESICRFLEPVVEFQMDEA